VEFFSKSFADDDSFEAFDISVTLIAALKLKLRYDSGNANFG
jgi:hypothetical protein